MVSRVRGDCRFPFLAMTLALGLWVISGSSAMAQGGAGGSGAGGGGMGGGGLSGGMGHTGAFGMSGVTAPSMGMGGGGRMSGMGSSAGSGSGLSSGSGYGGSGSGSGLGYGGSGMGYGSGSGMGYGYGGSGMGYGYGGYGLGYGYGGCGYGFYGSAPGNYYYPYASAMYPTVNQVFGSSSAYGAPASGVVQSVASQGRHLGIDEEPFVDTAGRKGMKVVTVYPGTPAAKAGLEIGDVIRSINGYQTERRGNLAWIIANAASNNLLKMNVQKIRDGREYTVTAQLP